MLTLSRAAQPAPVRMVHLGLGAFHRAHQAWWTGAVSRDDPWGIAAFTGRSPAAATVLAAQGGLFTLLVRAPGGDHAEEVSSISRAVDGADTASFTADLADPAVRVLTLTVTEAGYHRRGDGGLDFADTAVAADRHALTASNGGSAMRQPLLQRRHAPPRHAGVRRRDRPSAGDLDR
jgi:fructuronate reductase